jgi:hypothetical protein
MPLSPPAPFLTGKQLIALAAVFVALVVLAMEVAGDHPAVSTAASLGLVGIALAICVGGLRHTLRTGYISGRYPWGFVEAYRVDSPVLYWSHVALGLAVLVPVMGFGVLVVFYKTLGLFD